MAATPQEFFSSAVAHYAWFRTGYPPRGVAALVEALGIGRTDTVVDVGCGTGQLSVPLATYAGTVLAIDPVADMLATGSRLAAQSGSTNIRWLLGDAGNLDTLVAPGATAATFAASFHWTDRAKVARDLDRLLAPTGSIVTINDVLGDDERPDWVIAVDELRLRYLGDDHAAATAPYTDPPESHRDVLSASPFADIQTQTWEWNRELTIDEAVGLQFTYSFSTPAAFGDRVGRFAEDAHAIIEKIHPDGRVTEPFRMEVLIASRPVAAGGNDSTLG